MTIICAMRVGGISWVGSDSRVRAGGITMPVVADKWQISPDGKRALGTCGFGRVITLLRATPFYSATNTAAEVAEFLRDLVRGDEHAGKAEDGEGPLGYDNAFIYADANGIWDIDPTFAVWPLADGSMWARGSGMYLALGADHALRWTQDPRITPKQRLTVAVAAAIEQDVGCGGPIFVQQLGG